MNDSTGLERLEDVLDAYVTSGVDQIAALDQWIQRYPQYERDLTDFAVSWSLMESMPTGRNVKEIDEEVLILRGMSVVQNLLHERSLEAGQGSEVPIESLLTEGQARGFDPHQLAQVAGLGIITLGKLDRRLIRYFSIPQQLIDHIASAIEREKAEVVAYLQQGPTLAAATEHRSERPPALADPEDFFDAIRNDPTINQSEAARWLALEQSKDKP